VTQGRRTHSVYCCIILTVALCFCNLHYSCFWVGWSAGHRSQFKGKETPWRCFTRTFEKCPNFGRRWVRGFNTGGSDQPGRVFECSQTSSLCDDVPWKSCHLISEQQALRNVIFANLFTDSLSACFRQENIFRLQGSSNYKLKQRMNLPHKMCISESKELHAKKFWAYGLPRLEDLRAYPPTAGSELGKLWKCSVVAKWPKSTDDGKDRCFLDMNPNL